MKLAFIVHVIVYNTIYKNTIELNMILEILCYEMRIKNRLIFFKSFSNKNVNFENRVLFKINKLIIQTYYLVYNNIIYIVMLVIITQIIFRLNIKFRHIS